MTGFEGPCQKRHHSSSPHPRRVMPPSWQRLYIRAKRAARRVCLRERVRKMNFWDIIAFFFWSYIFISYLMVLFWIIGDIFRDQTLNGWIKAVWVVCLVFLPILTALVYLVVRGKGMGERQAASVEHSISETEAYIRSVASSSPADEITKAKALLDAGTISETEFEALKAHVLPPAQRRPMAV